MATSAARADKKVRAIDVRVTKDALTVGLDDGRTLSVPLDWYPRLALGTPKERRNWILVGRGLDIHWPDLDEDIETEHLLLGRRSVETKASLQRWLDGRGAKKAGV